MPILTLRVAIIYLFYNDVQWADMTMLSAVRINYIPHKPYTDTASLSILSFKFQC